MDDMQEEEIVAEDDVNVHASVLENNTPTSLTYIFNTGVSILSTYGWLLVFGVAFFYYVWSKYKSRIEVWHEGAMRKKDITTLDARKVEARHEAMERSRMRLQQQHDQQVARYKEQQIQKEEETRQRKIQEWESHKEGKGYHSKQHADEQAGPSGQRNIQKAATKKSKLRQSDYNPLTGGGDSCAWRPGRRGFSGGG